MFEKSVPGKRGFELPPLDVPAVDVKKALGAAFARDEVTGFPEVSEFEVIRHFTRLSTWNYAIDLGMYPLGSCTMKYNPRVNEFVARLNGIATEHPYQPIELSQGCLKILDVLQDCLLKITGMDAVTLQPSAGAQGELTGLLLIRAYMESKGNARKKVLIPDSAHGTNPATAVIAGYEVENIRSDAQGQIDIEQLKRIVNEDVAALMVTNPSTLGVFEQRIAEAAEILHKAGALLYMDGANMNALAGIARPGDFGVDVMHLNLHKTFSTPHGGGGPGAGPVVFSERLAAYAPLPLFVQDANGFRLIEDMEEARAGGATPLGRMCAFQGQMGMFVRALSYMLSHGADGLRQVAEDAVLSANYILASLKDVMNPPYEGPCMHEALFDDAFLKDTGITTLDIAKRLIDEGLHPMTVYFPLVVHGAMLIEPTETESKATLDEFIAVMRELANEAKSGEVARFKAAPVLAPRRRLDETRAARQPVLRWKPDREG